VGAEAAQLTAAAMSALAVAEMMALSQEVAEEGRGLPRAHLAAARAKQAVRARLMAERARPAAATRATPAAMAMAARLAGETAAAAAKGEAPRCNQG